MLKLCISIILINRSRILMWELIWQALADIQARNVGVATKQW